MGKYRIVETQQKYVYGIFLVLVGIIYALRPLTTRDTLGYVNSFANDYLFDNLSSNFLVKYNGYEIGYIYLMNLFKSICNNYRIYFVFISVAGIILSVTALYRLTIFLFTDSCDNRSISSVGLDRELQGLIIALYISGYGFLYNGISVRAGLAMALGLWFVVSMLSKKRIRAIITLIIAISIQRTAFLFLIIYLIVKFLPSLKRQVHFFIWGLSGILLLSGMASRLSQGIIFVLNKLFTDYGINGYSSFLENFDTVGLRDIYMWLLYLLLIMICDNREKNQKYLNVVMFGELVVVFLYEVRAISRVYDMFYMLCIPLIVQFYTGYMLNDDNSIIFRNRKLIVIIITAISATLMLKTCFG